VKVTLTAKLKLTHTLEQKTALDRVCFAFRDASNFTSRAAFDLEKTSNSLKIHRAVYPTLREKYGLPSQLACSVSRYVGAAYKNLWTRVKQNSATKKANPDRRIKRYKGLDAAPKFVSRTLTYQYGKDYSFKKNQRVSLLTLEGRMVLGYEGYQKHLEYIQNGAEIGTGKLWYDKAKKQYFLLVSFEVTLPDPLPSSHKNVVGVDVGIRQLATATDTRNRSLFQSGGFVHPISRKYSKARKSLQAKGTRSATRRLVLLSGRERRFKADVNHRLSARVLKFFPNAFMGIEQLEGVRERTQRATRTNSSEKQRKSNRRHSTWAYRELHNFLGYKAPLFGSMVVKVDAHYTSQACPKCGHTCRENRPNKGLMFRCVSCGYELHSDLVGARNLSLRALLVRQDWISTGLLSETPDVSDVENKAARLKRYAELRWSPDTNQLL
jgi:putative transposase